MNKILPLISRLILGTIFLVAGINGFFVIFDLEPFITTSPEAMAIFQFKYLLIIEKSLEVVCGTLLVINQYTPLAVSILTPIVTNIFLLHLFVDHSLLFLAIILVIFNVYLLFYYKGNFIRILERKPKPWSYISQQESD